MESPRLRSRQKPVPLIPATVGGPPQRGAQEMAVKRQELRNLIVNYKGFGILSLIRLMIFESFKGFLLASMGIMLVVGQWLGPIGFAAHKFEDSTFEWCPGGAGPWARCVITAIAAIYFARRSVATLAHEQELPQAFHAYNMPKWWPLYRNLDLVITSLFFDASIYTVNLLIVFSDAAIDNMVIDVVALEFFTLIDDEYKKTLLAYDDSFLDRMLMHGGAAIHEEQRKPGPTYSARSSSWQPSPPGGSLSEALFNVDQVDAEAERPPSSDTSHERKSHGLCYDAIVAIVKIPLMIIRIASLIGGPLFAFIMIGYGPYCLRGT